MKQGFSLIELLVAISIGAVIILAIGDWYGNIYAGYLANKNKVSIEHNLRISMSLIKLNLVNAGVFASFSFHQEHQTAYQNISSCTDEWCQSIGVGVKSYPSGTNVINQIKDNGEVLRIQFGGNKASYFNNKIPCVNPSRISSIDFYNSDNVIAAKTYMISSSNRAYLINFDTVTTNNKLDTNCMISIESYIDNVMTVPDQTTITAVPFAVKYFYSANNRLYSVSYNGTSVTAPIIVANNVTKMSVMYIINNSTPVFNRTETNNSYAICNTDDMYDAGNPYCYNKWSGILSVTITLTGEIGTIKQVVTDSVGWRA